MHSESPATGIVSSVDGGVAEIAVPVAGCSGCGRQGACGIGRLAGGARTVRLRVPAPRGVGAGDAVHLAIPPEALARAAVLGYLVPAVLMLAGAAAGEFLGPGGAGGPLGLFVGLAIGVLATRFVRRDGLTVTRA